MPKTNEFIYFAPGKVVRLLSPVAREDLAKAVQRLINDDGDFSIEDVHYRYCGRIRGSLKQYGITISYLLMNGRLKTHRYTR